MNEKRAIEILENETRCIDRRARNKCNGGSDCIKCDLVLTDTEIKWAFAKAIKLLSMSPVAPIRHGYWIVTETGLYEISECSVCGSVTDKYGLKFCPDCGAKMDKSKYAY